MKQKFSFILALIITLIIAANYFFINSFENNSSRKILVQRVIDGDTFETETGGVIRLANINTPERGEYGYEEAKNFLKQFENKTVEIEEKGADKYQRTLAKVYTPDYSPFGFNISQQAATNGELEISVAESRFRKSLYLNLELVEQGLARKFLVDKSALSIFAEAEEQAINQEKGLWKKSQYFNCFDSEINAKEEFVIIKSSCGSINFDNWELRDESRKKYKFDNINIIEIILFSNEGTDNATTLFWKVGDVWNNDRDSLYLFDASNNLAHYHVYGY